MTPMLHTARLGLLTAAMAFCAPALAAGNEWKQLFNGKDLTGWTTWVSMQPTSDNMKTPTTIRGASNDPKQVVSVVDGTLRVSGEEWGGVHTVGLCLWFIAVPHITIADTTAIGFTTWAYAMRRLTAGQVASTTYLVPVVATGISSHDRGLYGVLGAVAAVSLASGPRVRVAALVGWAGGMLADVDVFIRSATGLQLTAAGLDRPIGFRLGISS